MTIRLVPPGCPDIRIKGCMQMQAVSIIVPTYNEAENIDFLLQRIFAVEPLRSVELEVVFSDGASTDDTCRRVECWTKSHRVKLIRSETNEGLSEAVMAGARAASGEFVVVMDADLSHPPEAIPELLAPLLAGDCDMVIGSRYITGGDTPEWPMIRKISSKIASWPARLLSDVKDPLAGFLAVRRERLSKMDREVCGFKIGLELLATSEDALRIREIPIIFRDRCYGTSKMGVKVVLDYCRQLLMLAGIELFPERLGRLVPILLAVLMADWTVMTMMLEAGFRPGVAHSLGLALAGGLCGMWLLYRCRSQEIPGKRRAEYTLGFVWVILLTILLRSGLVASLRDGVGGLSTVAVFIIGLFGCATGYLVNVCYVFSIGRKRISGPLVQRFYALGAAIYLIVLRLMYLGCTPLLPEEAQVRQSLWHSGLLRSFLGGSEPAMDAGRLFLFRSCTWLLWFVSALCLFRLAEELYDRATAFMACLLFAALPVFFGVGLFTTADALLVFFWVGTLSLLYRSLHGGSYREWLITGVLLGFGLQAHVQMTALLAGAVVYLLSSAEARKWLSTPMPYMALGISLLTTVPFFLAPADASPSTPEQVGWLESLLGKEVAGSYLVAVLLLTPTGLLSGIYAVVRWVRIGLPVRGSTAAEHTEKRNFVLLLFLLPLLLFLLPGLYSAGSTAAGGVVWLIMLPTMALTVDRSAVAGDSALYFLQMLWWPTIGVIMAGYGILLHLAVL